MADTMWMSSTASNAQDDNRAAEAHNEPRDTESIREDLEECLSNIQTSGSFAVFETLPDPLNPGIFLVSGGGIGLPLSDRDADAFITASHQAPFGKGEQTLVDTSVRKTWELSASEFELRNPAWEPFLKTIVAKVSAGLGVDATGKGVTAQLYKMLLYDEGAMFKAHQDSEKVPHMFGTLVIALPSEHEGGEVRVTHAGQTQILETSKSSRFNASYLAWFSDVSHEVRPVLSGRRLVLTYNLLHTTLGSAELAANTNKTIAKLRSLLPQWKESSREEECEPALAYLLDHQYTEASLRYDGLKGYDQQVVSHLLQVCKEFDFCVYLASIKRTVSGKRDGDDYGDNMGPIEYVEEDETVLTKVFDLDGVEVAQSLEFDKQTFIESEPFEDLDPDDEENEYTGNEGVDATLIYLKTVVLIMPRSSRVQFFFPPKKVKQTIYGQVGVEKEDPNEILKMVAWTKQFVIELLQRPDDREVGRELLVLLDGLTIKISSLPNLSDRLAHLGNLQSGLHGVDTATPMLQNYQTWLKSEITRCLTDSSLSLETAEDGAALVNISKTLPSQTIFTYILPAVKRNISNPAMIMSFLTALVDATTAGGVPSAISETIFRDVVSDISENFSLRFLGSQHSNKRLAYAHTHNRPTNAPIIAREFEDSRNIAAFMIHCCKFSLFTELSLITTKIIEEAKFVPIDFSQSLHLPMLQALATSITSNNLHLHLPLGPLFQNLLAIYIVNYVGDEPQPPASMARQALTCPCNPCQSLTHFLLDPKASVHRLNGYVAKWKHIQTGLGYGYNFDRYKAASPSYMIITKSQEGYQHEYISWVTRRDNAKKNIAKLGTDFHKLYFGQWLDAITNLRVNELQPLVQSIGGNSLTLAPIGLSAVDNASNRTLPPITKRKIPNSVIVIDD